MVSEEMGDGNVASFVLGDSSKKMLHLAQLQGKTSAQKPFCHFVPFHCADLPQIFLRAPESPIEHDGMQLVAFSHKHLCLRRFVAINFYLFCVGFGFHVEHYKVLFQRTVQSDLSERTTNNVPYYVWCSE